MLLDNSTKSSSVSILTRWLPLILIVSFLATSGELAKAQANEWTWIGGSNKLPKCGGGLPGACGQSGVYGSLGVAASGNTPGARTSGMVWTDKNDTTWLFGGSGYDGSGTNDTLNDLWKFSPVTGEWTWVGGKNTAGNYSGVFGTLGVASVDNNPGSRYGAQVWSDSKGNLWMFSGAAIDAAGHSGALNDLWRLDSETGEWTWIGGPSELTQMGSQGYGSKAVYGTLGVPSSKNLPGARLYAATWVDNEDNLWMFGGLQYDFAKRINDDLNDLWKFDTSTNEWTWMGGSNECCQDGTYGVLGVSNTDNMPGSRDGAAGWTDREGNLWLFGGIASYGPKPPTYEELNDLWKLDAKTKEWTWISGSNATGNICGDYGGGSDICGRRAHYGERGVPSPENVPPGISFANGWTDTSGRLWLFGGDAIDAADVEGDLNDLWEFDPKTLQWMWMGGGQSIWVSGSYGVMGEPGAANQPGSRVSNAIAAGKSNQLWLFGGAGTDSAGRTGYLNDLWNYVIPTPKEQSIDFRLPSGHPSYGGKAIEVSATASSGLPIYFTVLSGPGKISGHTLAVTGAGDIVIAANQAGNANYAAANEVKQTIVVEKAKLTVTADSYTIQQGAKIPKLGYQIKGFADGDTVQSATTGAPYLKTGATSKSAPGKYAVKVVDGTLRAKNYTFALVDGTLTIK